jgi:hypothetical protein
LELENMKQVQAEDAAKHFRGRITVKFIMGTIIAQMELHVRQNIVIEAV